MLLAIDAGNTNVVFAVFDGDKISHMWRCATDQRRTSDEYAVWLRQLMAMENIKRSDISGAIIGSVVPQATHHLQRLCADHFNCTALVVGDKDMDTVIGIDVDRPEEVGADRLANAVAAVEDYDAPLIVLDFGTATTFDVVDAKGCYAGGAIAPGINLSADALHRAAAKLPKIDVIRPDKAIGRNTVDAMRSGVFWGYVGMIEGLVARITAEMGKPMRVIATGGLSVLFADATSTIEHVDKELTLRGLYLIARKNGLLNA